MSLPDIPLRKLLDEATPGPWKPTQFSHELLNENEERIAIGTGGRGDVSERPLWADLVLWTMTIAVAVFAAVTFHEIVRAYGLWLRSVLS